MANNEMTFEEKFQALTEAVKRLESDEITLDEALTTFESGIGHFKACKNKLSDAESSVKLVIDDLINGGYLTKDFYGEE
jgi:exodeoxyribonuclease VII small subunit